MKKILLTILWLLAILMPSVSWAQSSEAYAVLSDDVSGGKILTFYYDDQRVAREGMLIVPFDAADRPWNEQREDITSVVFDDSFSSCTTLTSTANWFWYCHNLTTITGISNLKTDNVTNMSGMFYGCRSLTSLDVSGFKTQNVTDMSWMFYECYEVTTLDVTQFDTHNVTDMSYLFSFCKKLTTLDVSGFNTANVTNMTCMFADCNEITSIDVSHFNTANVTDMSNMFSSCYKLASVDVSGFNTANVTTMASMFISCYEFTSLDLSSFNTANVANMGYMFAGNHQLSTIYVSSLWSTAAVTNSDNMFDGCTSLAGGAGTSLNTGHIDATYAHIDGGSSNPGYFTENSVISFADTNVKAICVQVADANNDGEVSFAEAAAMTTDFGTLFSDRSDVTTFNEFQYFTGIKELENTSFSNSSLTSIILPSSIVTIGSQVLQGTHLQSITIPNSVTAIGSSAFQGNNLKSAYISKSVTSIGEHAFMGYDLESLEIDSENPVYDSRNNCNAIIVTATNTIQQACPVTTIPNTVTAIGNGAFWWIIPKHRTITLPASLTSIGEDNFSNLDTVISKIDVPFEIPTSAFSDDMYNLATLVVPDGTVDAYRNTTAWSQFQNIQDLTPPSPEPYAVMSSYSSSMTLTFYYDDQKTARNGVGVGPFTPDANSEWYSIRENITSVVFDASFDNCRNLTSTAYWFNGCKNLTTISGIEYLHTDNVTDIRAMFGSCSSLTSIDLSHFNTESVTNFYGMFYDCTGLTSLDVTGFNTANATRMDNMFENCSGLAVLDLHNFNTANVQNMSKMFLSCTGLTALDLGTFNTANVTNMTGMFSGCSALVTIYVGDGWSTAKAGSGSEMFYGCTSLVGGAGTTFSSSRIGASYAHIDGGSSNPGYFTRSGDAPYVAPEPYARLTGDRTTGITVTFYYDSNRTDSDKDIFSFEASTGYRWGTYASDIVSIVIDESFANYTGLTSVTNLLNNCPMLTSIEGLANLNTSAVTSMEDMFSGCGSLKTIDVSGLNTSNVTNMTYMFANCIGLTSLDLSSFNTSNLTTMEGLCYNCSSLSTIILPQSLRTIGKSAFSGCISLTSVHIPEGVMGIGEYAFMGAGLTSVDLPEGLESIGSNAFRDNPLTEITIPANVGGIGGEAFEGATTTVTKVTSLSQNPAQFESGDHVFASYVYSNVPLYVPAGTIQTYKAIDGWAAFQDIREIGSSDQPETYAVLSEANSSPASHRAATAQPMVLTFYYDTKKAERGGMDIGPFTNAEERPWHEMAERIENVIFDSAVTNDTTITSTAHWFQGCTSLTTIYGIENLKTNNVTRMDMMFESCSKLTSLDVSGFNTANVTDMHWMFRSCSSLESIDVSGFNTQKVMDIHWMFRSCSALKTLDVSKFKTDSVTNMNGLFYGCSELTSLDVSGFNTSKVTNMGEMFNGCSGLTSLDVSGFNTANVTDMHWMFRSCRGLATIIAGDGWNTTSVTESTDMFTGCSNLVGGKGTTYDENHVDATYARIDGGPSNPGYFTSLWSDRKLVQWRQVGGKEYRLYKASNKNDFRTNADGWNMYRTRLTLDIISATDTTTTVVDDGSIYCEQNLFSNAMTQCMMIDVENNKMYVFANSKTDARDYSMDGYVYISPIEHPSFTKETVFTDANWGWFSYFRGVENGQPLLSHFSYMGYYDELSKRNADGTWSTDTEDSPIASPSNRESNWLVTRKFTVVGDTSSDEVTLDGVTYTVRNGGNAWVTWLDNGTYVESLTIPESVTADGRTLTVSGLAPLSCYTLTRLQSLELPSTVDMLGESVLVRCGNLRSLTVNRNQPPTLVLDNGALLQFTDIDSVNCELRVPYGSKALYGSADGWRKFQNIVEMNAPVAEPEPYAVLSDNNTVLTFYYDEKKAERNGMDVTSIGGLADFVDGLWTISGRGWNDYCKVITTSVFDPSFADCTSITSTSGWFCSMTELTSISGLNYLNTANVTDMNNMFRECSKLESLDVSNFNTGKVNNMWYMFEGCSGLTSLDVSGFKTDNVTDMSGMFYGCSGLTSLDVSKFNTTKVKRMSQMFEGCSSLTSLDVSGFKTDNVTNMHFLFRGCEGLTSLDVTNFNTANVTSMWGMFTGCPRLTSLDVSGFKTDKVEEMAYMFAGCSGLTSLDVTNFITANVTGMQFMFEGCSGLTTLDVSNFNTSNVTDMKYMFRHCYGLTTIYAGSGWSTTSVTESNDMFTGSTNLIGGKGTKYDANHTDHTYAHIDEGPSNPGYFTDKNAPTIDYTFDYNGVLTVRGETTMADALSAAGGTEEVAKTITAVVWAKGTPLTNSDLQGLDNPNMLVYVADASLAPSNRDNVVIGNDSTGYLAKNIMLTDVESGNNNFYCPQEFTAEMISYTRNFQQQTEVGVSRGWETIALPFQVQTIMHEKNGLLAPFGNTSSDKHFWLRQIAMDGATTGLSAATQILPNTPYLISMPNSEEYPAEYNQNGRVTFSSQNVRVPNTEPSYAQTNIPNVGMVMFVPTFSAQAANNHIYALNVLEQRGEHKEGSIFEANYRTVRPFEAYTYHEDGQRPAPRYISIGDINSGTTGIESLTPSLSKGDGAWYTIDGRRLQNKPTQKGVYILNGRKTIVK